MGFHSTSTETLAGMVDDLVDTCSNDIKCPVILSGICRRPLFLTRNHHTAVSRWERRRAARCVVFVNSRWCATYVCAPRSSPRRVRLRVESVSASSSSAALRVGIVPLTPRRGEWLAAPRRRGRKVSARAVIGAAAVSGSSGAS